MIKLTDILKELNIQPKPELGKGSEQTAYPYLSNPDFVLKKYNRSMHRGKTITGKIEKLKDLSEKYPDLVTKIKIINNDTYAQEKLDWKTLSKDIDSECIKVWNQLVKDYKKAYTSDLKTRVTDYIKQRIDFGFWSKPPKVKNQQELDDLMDDMTYYIYHTKFLVDPYVYENYTKNSELIKKLKPIMDNEELNDDPHNDNLGYDKQGNIKVLDI